MTTTEKKELNSLYRVLHSRVNQITPIEVSELCQKVIAYQKDTYSNCFNFSQIKKSLEELINSPELRIRYFQPIVLN